MKIIVTGGAGFIASQIVNAYLDQGHQVSIIDNLSSGFKKNLNPKANFHECDINNPQITGIIKQFQPDIVNHHAAQINVRTSIDDPVTDASTNIIGSLNLLQACIAAGSVKKFIFASSGGAISGDVDTVPTPENHPPNPISPYGIAKLSVEYYLNYYQLVHGLNSLAFRYANVYGPRQNPHGEAGVVAIFFQRLLNNQEFIVNGDGGQTRDFVYVGDVVNANLKALDTDITGIYNIGTGRSVTINQLVKHMKANLDVATQIKHGPAKAGEQLTSCLDASKAAKDLDWRPQVDLETGLEATAEFFKHNV